MFDFMDIEKLALEYLIETDIENKRDILGNIYRGLKGLIYKTCKKYSGYAELDDLEQECFFGVLRALETWEPDKRKFLGHVMDHLSWHLYRYIQQSSDGKNILREYQLYRNYEESYFIKFGRYPSIKSIALNFRVTADRVQEIKDKARHIQNRVSWDDVIPGTDIQYSETIPDIAQDTEDIALRACVCEEIRSAVNRLPMEEREIITRKYLQPGGGRITREERHIQQKALRHLFADNKLRELNKEEFVLARAYHWKDKDTSHTEWSAIRLTED